MLHGCTPWPDEVATRWRRLGLWEDITLWDLFEQTALRLPGKVALVHGDHRFTYRELVERSQRLLGPLDLGLRPLDRVVCRSTTYRGSCSRSSR